MRRERNVAFKADVFESLIDPQLFDCPRSWPSSTVDDERFLEPIRRKLTARRGRPTIPLGTYLRMVYLKRRYRLGFEALVKEVADSLVWRRFCRLRLTDKVPDATTLIKLTHRLGPDVIEQLNDALMAQLVEARLMKRHGQRIRVDTTVVEANIHHPTDAGLLADGVRVLTRLMRRAKEAGIGVRLSVRDRLRSVRRRLRRIGQMLRRGGEKAQAEVDRLTAEVALRAEQTLQEAQRMARAVQRRIRQLGPAVGSRYRALAQGLVTYTRRLRRVLEQTRLRLQGIRTIPDRLVSLFDPDARPIRRGKLSKPVEFGYKLVLVETQEGFIRHFRLHGGNPSDDSVLVDAVAEHIHAVGATPRAVAADRGMSSRANEAALRAMGIAYVALPARSGRARRLFERRRAFRRLLRWRSGQEGRIAHLKHAFELDRSRYRGAERAFTWIGEDLLAHNLTRAARRLLALAPAQA
ncbi:ISNCY family transposase [Geochorda subterranea]|uniref:ISNCY family transposase n=1 Tax=Geochorda subterranea TaxID=3109564 RepID=A0ABZ1BSJ2_9FIRM|nr:ISNCY family transposase [Limnochorda sp. LNt]WRP15752.1 ISNCY family transposase [Limnochorda sp. LNt]